jgi:hypothetical protein
MSEYAPTETIFSTNDEFYNCTDMHEAICDTINNDGPEVGDTITIWEGEKKPIKASDFLHRSFGDTSKSSYGD